MFLFLLAVNLLSPPAEPTPKTAKEALQPFNALIGSWKGTGYPDGSREERQKGFWRETLAFAWHFKGSDVAVYATIDKGKHFTRWEFRYLPEKSAYQLTATTPNRDTQKYTGVLSAGKQGEQIFTFTRTDSTESQRLVITLLHRNRFLYRVETKPKGAPVFARQYQVGATKEGEPFASVPTGPECVVSGGQAKIAVSYKGKTYYVCCSGCRDAFNDDPEKFVREYEAKQKSKK
jgi:YHS domain-containing protein